MAATIKQIMKYRPLLMITAMLIGKMWAMQNMFIMLPMNKSMSLKKLRSLMFQVRHAP